VDSVAVQVVVEASSDCSDRARAEAALEGALAGARAPRRATSRELADTSWSVTLSVPRGPVEKPAGKAAVATISDDAGAVVAERTISDPSARSCAALARAAGAWAALVLDDELARAHASERDGAGERDARDPVGNGGSAVGSASSSRATPTGSAPWPRPRASAPVGEDDGGVLGRTGDARSGTIEAGVMVFVRDGLTSTTGGAGVAPFASFEIAEAWFLRPSFAIGGSTSPVAVGRTTTTIVHYGGRLDLCRRIPGNYVERRGLELDACASGEVAAVSGAGVEARVRPSAGPAGILRGRVGEATSFELRAVTGANFDRTPLHTEGKAPMLYAIVEVGMSMRFR
jgi:hypothetical protein